MLQTFTTKIGKAKHHPPMIVRNFVFIALFFGSLLAFLTPPFQSPDEYNHFYRAWQVSEGKLTPEIKDGNRLGGELPAALDSLTKQFIYLKNNPAARLYFSQIGAAYDLRIDESERRFTDFPNTAIYAPTAYVPQATGIVLGRLLTDRLLLIFYIARLFNLLCWIALIASALRLIPFQKQGLAFLALLPSSLAIACTLNADVSSNGLAFWLIAWAVSGTSTRRKEGAALASGMLLSVNKLILAPFFALFALPLLHERWNKLLPRVAVPLLLMLAGALVWGRLADRWFVPYDQYAPELRDGQTLNPGVDPERQLSYVLHHPFEFAGVAARSFLDSAPSTAAHFVGKFGWEKNYLPGWCMALLWLGLLAVFCTESAGLRRRQSTLLMAAGLASVLLWAITMYALWCPVGATVLGNWQGRYFIPIVPLLCLGFGNALLTPWRKTLDRVAGAVILLSNIAMLYAVFARYWG
ncbi:MAG: DUF2142 domain-containing protein [Saprospiraceae bacterium]|nr:DUF2142 domain-containing protein [Saprospiraceae bacterium]